MMCDTDTAGTSRNRKRYCFAVGKERSISRVLLLLREEKDPRDKTKKKEKRQVYCFYHLQI